MAVNHEYKQMVTTKSRRYPSGKKRIWEYIYILLASSIYLKIYKMLFILERSEYMSA